MRRLTLLVMGATLGAPKVAAPQGQAASFVRTPSAGSSTTLRVVITPDVYDELGRIADTLRLETVRCLIGAAQGDSLLIDLAWKPRIATSMPNTVRYELCPAATVALWHNHPRSPGSEAEPSCYLSRTDIEQALRSHAPPLQIVQVTASVACWWAQWQVAPQADAQFLLPLPDQGRGRFGDLEPTAACLAVKPGAPCGPPPACGRPSAILSALSEAPFRRRTQLYQARPRSSPLRYSGLDVERATVTGRACSGIR